MFVCGLLTRSIYLIYFLRVASHHDGTATSLQMRADGPEPQRKTCRLEAISAISTALIANDIS